MATSGGMDAEYIGKYIKIVKDSLAKVMKSANDAINQNAEVDLRMKSSTQSEGTSNKLEKHLEDFYTACDQLQLYLEIMRETENQTTLSMKYTPKPVSNSKTENVTGTQTYTEYLSTVRTQIAAAKELQDLLSDFCLAQLS